MKICLVQNESSGSKANSHACPAFPKIRHMNEINKGVSLKMVISKCLET